MADTMASQSQLRTLLDLGDKYDGWMNWLHSIRPRYVGTPMLAKIDAAIAEGENKRSAIGSVVQTVRDAWSWVQEKGGDAWGTIKGALGLGDMGLLPVAIPAAWAWGLGAAAVGTAIVVMTNWINSASTLRRELDSFDRAVQSQVDRGVAPDVAVQNASAAVTGIVGGEAGRVTAGDGGILGQFGTAAKWGAIVLAVYFGAKQMGWIK